MFTSVVSLHTDPLTCGVARFSQELAKRLDVPFRGLRERTPGGDRFPLFSLKMSEMDMVPYDHFDGDYGVFWHDRGDYRITEQAQIVFHGDPSLGRNGLWCPPVVAELQPPVTSHLRIFTCGMASKFNAKPYERLRELLDETPHTAQLRVSVAVHEGTSLTDAEAELRSLKAIMGRHVVYVLGCLTDEAVARELKKCLAVASFYPKGVRANNTTAHAAMSQGQALITNLDADSPMDFIHRVTCYDINKIEQWPTLSDFDRVALNGQALYYSTYDWDHLVARITECANSK